MKKIIISLLALSVFANPLISYAQASDSVGAAQRQLEAAAKKAGIGTANTLEDQIAAIVKFVLGFLGVIFLVLTIVAGFKWMTAGGDSAVVKAAQQSMTNATIGLGIILFSYLISNFVIFSLLNVLGK